MSREIVGFTGDKGIGVGEAVSYLTQQGFGKYSLAKPLQDTAAALGLPADNETLSIISHEFRTNSGPDILAKHAVDWVESYNGSRVVIYGIRNPAEIYYLQDNLHPVILGITMSDEKQYELARRRDPSLSFQTAAEFMRAKWDALGDEGPGYRLQLEECLRWSDRVIENNGSISQLFRELNTALGENNIYIEGSRSTQERR